MKKQRKRSSGCAVKLSPGLRLTDKTNSSWLVGSAIGAGAFGDVYLVSQNSRQTVPRNSPHVAKVEPMANGPLFVEMNFYLRVGRKDKIKKWKEERKLRKLGMPHLIAFGSQLVGCDRFRFIVIPRYGEDIGTIFNRHGGKFSLKTAVTIGLQIIDILEYIHYHGYIHADIKGSNIMLGYNKGEENTVYLVDFGLACSFVDSFGVHKEYVQDRRRAHEGTLEYTSRDAHIGAHSRRGDLENLGYNLMEWLSGMLPWTSFLNDPDEVATMKNVFMANIPLLMMKCFPHGNVPVVLRQYLEYIVSLKFATGPDYSRIRSLLTKGLKTAGFAPDGKLQFGDVDQKDRKACSEIVNDENTPIPEMKLQDSNNKRRTRRCSTLNDTSANFDWVKVIQSNPEREAKHKVKEKTASTVTPVVGDLDPSLRRPVENAVSNPTPPMLRIILKWLLELIFVDNRRSSERIKVLQQWYWSCRSKFLSSPPKDMETKAISSLNSNSKNPCMEHYDLSSGISAYVMFGEAQKIYVKARIRGREVIITCKNIDSMFKSRTENLRVNLGESLHAESAEEVISEDEEPQFLNYLLQQTKNGTGNPPPNGERQVNFRASCSAKERCETPRLDHDEFMAKFKPVNRGRSRERSSSNSRWASRDRLRATPARRQRSVTPADTFYTPYRGPCALRFERSSSVHSRSNRRSRSPSRHREVHNRGRSLGKSREHSHRTRDRSNNDRERYRGASPHQRSDTFRKRGRHAANEEERRSDKNYRSRYSPSPPRKRGRPSKKELERRHARRSHSHCGGNRVRSHDELERRRSPSPRKRGRPSKKDLERRAARAYRQPSPPVPSKTRDNSPRYDTRTHRRRSRSEDREFRTRYSEHNRLSRKDSQKRASMCNNEASPVIERNRYPWRMRRRSVSRPVDYAYRDDWSTIAYMTRSRAKSCRRSSPSRKRSTSAGRHRRRRGSRESERNFKQSTRGDSPVDRKRAKRT